jgi:hypothetical protein
MALVGRKPHASGNIDHFLGNIAGAGEVLIKRFTEGLMHHGAVT